MLDLCTTEIVVLRAVADYFKPLSEKAMQDGRLFSLEILAEMHPRDLSELEPDNFMPVSSTLFFYPSAIDLSRT